MDITNGRVEIVGGDAPASKDVQCLRRKEKNPKINISNLTDGRGENDGGCPRLEDGTVVGFKDVLSNQTPRSPPSFPCPASPPPPPMRADPNPRLPDDPFAAALMPPPQETEDERAKRVNQQEEAARISREIDESLQETKKFIERRKKATKVLLLGKLNSPSRSSAAFTVFKGQAESGKSTTLRSELSRPWLHIVLPLMITATNRRLSALLLSFSIQTGEGSLEIGHSAQSHQVFFHASSPSQPCPHTVHRSVRTILQVIQTDWETIGPVKPTSPIPGFSRRTGSLIGPPTQTSQKMGDKEDREPILTDVHRRLLMRLSPLVSMEENLTKKLFPHPPDPKEVSVRGGTNWKSSITRLAREKDQKTPRPRSSQGTVPREEGTHILVTFKEDIIALWNDPVVHRVLKRRGYNVRDMSGL